MIKNLPFKTDKGVRGDKRIGLIVLASDYTIDHEFRKIFPIENIDYFLARIQNSPNITPETLFEMGDKISSTLQLILPGDKLDVVGYGCTSATAVLGEKKIFEFIRTVHPQALCTTPITAAFEAFKKFKAKKIAILTPYRDDVNKNLINYFEKAGFDISAFGSFNEERDPIVSCIDKQSIIKGIKDTIKGNDVDMIFISCTSIKFMDYVAEVEKMLGIPVTTSNHAMAWHCMRLSGIRKKISNFGKLYQF